mgnify:CR=1 FL=1
MRADWKPARFEIDPEPDIGYRVICTVCEKVVAWYMTDKDKVLIWHARIVRRGIGRLLWFPKIRHPVRRTVQKD